MSRWIDADALKASYIVTSTTTNSLCHLYVSIEDINNAPSIDIVRCRECKWSKANGTYQWCGRLDSTARITDDDFCSRGERKESE